MAGLGVQSRTDMLHMSVQLFFAPWARPANQSVIRLNYSNKVRRLWKAPSSNKASPSNRFIEDIVNIFREIVKGLSSSNKEGF